MKFLRELKESFFLLLANYCTRLSFFDKKRYKIYRLAGIRVREKCTILGPLIIRPIGRAGNIEIGKHTFINTEVRFGCPLSKIKIGDYVEIGPRVSFETVNHNLLYKKEGLRGGRTFPITVENHVWIGAGAIILPGVKIGFGSVVAAGAVVNKDVEPHTVVAGIPAKCIKSLYQSQ